MFLVAFLFICFIQDSFKYIIGTYSLHFISVASCTEGWPQWYRVARSSPCCPEMWETKRTSRWTGNGSPARATTTWCGYLIKTTSSLARWDREWVRSSLPLGAPSQVHWIDRNIWQVPFVLQDIQSKTCWELRSNNHLVSPLSLSQPLLSRVSFTL